MHVNQVTLVLTVNVLLSAFIMFGDILAPAYCGLKWHKPLAGLASHKPSWCKHLLTVFFFYQMSIVSDECIYFWSCPHLFKDFSQCVSLRWRQDPLFYFFYFLF